jgi:hypothetical protein
LASLTSGGEDYLALFHLGGKCSRGNVNGEKAGQVQSTSLWAKRAKILIHEGTGFTCLAGKLRAREKALPFASL